MTELTEPEHLSTAEALERRYYADLERAYREFLDALQTGGPIDPRVAVAAIDAVLHYRELHANKDISGIDDYTIADQLDDAEMDIQELQKENGKLERKVSNRNALVMSIQRVILDHAHAMSPEALNETILDLISRYNAIDREQDKLHEGGIEIQREDLEAVALVDKIMKSLGVTAQNGTVKVATDLGNDSE